MRWVHGEPLSALLGASRRVSRPDFLKGLIAVLITSALSEILLYLLQPGIARGTISLSSWLLFLVPIVALTLLQTSSEEVLFRGYLLRGLANRFSNPLIWALLPGLPFTSLHWSSASSPTINACVLVSIAAFALLLTLVVHATGNLGAALGPISATI
jgi:membrane protease YdiL (CAAX protease family)